MFSSFVPSSPVMEVTNLNAGDMDPFSVNDDLNNNNFNLNNNDINVGAANGHGKGTLFNDYDFGQLMNSYYMARQPSVMAQQAVAPSSNENGMTTNLDGFMANPMQVNYQDMPQQMESTDNSQMMYPFNTLMQNPSSILSTHSEEMAGNSTSTATSTSVASELDNMNLQFIHPQDVVGFNYTTPPMEEFDSRRASLLEPAMAMPSFNNQQPQPQHHQHHHHPHHLHAQPLHVPLPTTEDLLSSVETTPLMSNLPMTSSLDEVAHQKLASVNTVGPLFDLNGSDSFSHMKEEFTSEDKSFAGTNSSGLSEDDDLLTLSGVHHQHYSEGNDVVEQEEEEEEEEDIPEITEIKKCRVVRGISSGGCSTRPPKEAKNSTSKFSKVKLHLASAGPEEMCLPKWNNLEKTDGRRIIRIERRQHCEHIVADFSIVGSAMDHPEPKPAEEGVDFIEVSCLEINVDEHYDDFETNTPLEGGAGDETIIQEENTMNQGHTFNSGALPATQYYITSVEVIRIVELLIGSQLLDSVNRRRERGRVRSNLVPFWSRKPVSSKKSSTGSPGAIPSSITGGESYDSKDFRVELAQRIMGYQTRKPRGFDKEVRILKWDKLVPALKRALQSYYAEIPEANF